MKHAAVFAALGVACIASAQEWRFELSEPVLTPESPSTFVTLSIDPGPAAYAFATADLGVRATDAGWSGLIALLPVSPPWGPSGYPGRISGGDVTGISVFQFAAFGWAPIPGKVDAWRGTFTATDFSVERAVELSTRTTRFEVYTEPFPVTTREPRTPIEGFAQIQIVPAPAGLALLGLGGVALARRRRPAASPGGRESR